MEVFFSNHGWLLLAIVFFSFLFTFTIRWYCLRRKLFDIPNARSSHTLATPRGAGVAISVVAICAYSYLFLNGHLNTSFYIILVSAGAALTILGFFDDFGNVPIRTRLVVHVLVALVALLAMGGLPLITLWGEAINLGWFGHLFALFYIIWLLNLYNFMDGIDGIAAVEAITVCLGIAIIYFALGLGSEAIVPLVIAASVLGFIFLNFPVAKIFMGDSGSGFLGVSFAVLSLHSLTLGSHLIWVWIILLGIFIVDATLTLLRRFFDRQKVYQAHCSHAYQHAARQYNSHKVVASFTGALNFFWLFPVALCVAFEKLDGLLGVFIAYTPLIFLALYFKAGKKEASV